MNNSINKFSLGKEEKNQGEKSKREKQSKN